jgi:DNA-binding transcriptional LysR family regulator
LTTSGKRLFRFADYLYHEESKVMRDLANLNKGEAGELVITTSSIPSEFILPNLLVQFKQHYPHINIRLEFSNSLQIVDDLKKEKYELGFCSTYVKSKKLDAFKIANDHIILAVYPEHPFAHQKRIRLVELEGESIVLKKLDTAINFKHKSPISILTQYGLNIMQCKNQN